MKSIPIQPAAETKVLRDARGHTAGAPWRPRWLLIAPHRLAFFMAALMLALSSVWWAVVLLTRVLNLTLFWAVPAAAAHALLMS
ncbi:MAG: NnrS family protein, partial [Rhodoferax sp.]